MKVLNTVIMNSHIIDESTSDFTIAAMCDGVKLDIPCHQSKIKVIPYFESLLRSGTKEAIEKRVALDDVDIDAIRMIIESLYHDIDLSRVPISAVCSFIIHCLEWVYDKPLQLANDRLRDIDLMSFPLAMRYYNELPKESQDILLGFTQSEEFALKAGYNLTEDVIYIIIANRQTLYSLILLICWGSSSYHNIPRMDIFLDLFNIDEVFSSRSYLIHDLLELSSKVPSMKLLRKLMSKMSKFILLKNKYDIDDLVVPVDSFDISKLLTKEFEKRTVVNRHDNPPIRYNRMTPEYDENAEWVLELNPQIVRLDLKSEANSRGITFSCPYKPDDKLVNIMDNLYSRFAIAIDDSKYELNKPYFNVNEPQSIFRHPVYYPLDKSYPPKPINGAKPIIYLNTTELSRSSDCPVFVDVNTNKSINPANIKEGRYNITFLLKVSVYVNQTISITKRIHRAYIHDYIPMVKDNVMSMPTIPMMPIASSMPILSQSYIPYPQPASVQSLDVVPSRDNAFLPTIANIPYMSMSFPMPPSYTGIPDLSILDNRNESTEPSIDEVQVMMKPFVPIDNSNFLNIQGKADLPLSPLPRRVREDLSSSLHDMVENMMADDECDNSE